MHLFTKIVVGFAALVGLSSAIADSPEVDGFRYHLANTDCGYVTASRAFGLRVMGWDFPVPAGYDFRGFDRGLKRDTLWLQKLSNVEPLKYLENHPGTSVAEAVRKKAEQEANIYYYEADEAENLDSEEYAGFEAVEWQGLSLLFRASTGGRQVETTVYQAIVRTEGHNDRLSLVSTNVEQITKIIACAEKAE